MSTNYESKEQQRELEKSKDGSGQLSVSFRGLPIPMIDAREFQNYSENPLEEVLDYLKSSHDEEMTIVGVHYGDGGISAVKLSNDMIVTVEDAIGLVNAGLIHGYTTGTTRYGGQTLRSYPDSGTSNNLYDLPEF